MVGHVANLGLMYKTCVTMHGSLVLGNVWWWVNRKCVIAFTWFKNETPTVPKLNNLKFKLRYSVFAL